VIDPERGLAELADHRLRPEAYRLVVRGNALRVFDKLEARIAG
jgi:hypothetical protein